MVQNLMFQYIHRTHFTAKGNARVSNGISEKVQLICDNCEMIFLMIKQPLQPYKFVLCTLTATIFTGKLLADKSACAACICTHLAAEVNNTILKVACVHNRHVY